MFTNAQEIISIIEKRKNKKAGVEHFRKYMDSIGNPHTDLKYIHIAGTNGKGSTTNYVRSMLQEAGYHVGTFTSPYMITHLDRIRINDVYIQEEAFVAIANSYYDSWIEAELSMFEIDTCIALLYFCQQKVDFCIMEVGIGGRTDCTNIITPLVSAITNIGLDHMEILGDTLEQIAAEKAGIIKPYIDVITGEQKEVCLDVFDCYAQRMHAHCYRVDNIQSARTSIGMQFSYKRYKELHLSTKASYQCKNAALAIEIVDYLVLHHGLQMQEQAMRKGLEKANWIGRFEIIHTHPTIILDGAHNVHGIQALCDSLAGMGEIKVIFSVLKDKNFEVMLDRLSLISHDIVLCQFQNERVLDMHILKKRAYARVVDDYRIAIQAALKEEKTVVVTGSLYFISEVRAYWFQHQQSAINDTYRKGSE